MQSMNSWTKFRFVATFVFLKKIFDTVNLTLINGFL